MKRFTKHLLTGVTCATLGLSGFAVTKSVLSNQSVFATDSNAEIEQQTVDSLQDRIVHINLSKQLTDKINELSKSDNKVDIKILDDLSYYAISFWSEDAIVISENNKNSAVLSSEEILNKLLLLYDKNEYERSFEIKEDSTINVLKDLIKPENYDVLISEIKEKSEEKVEDALESSSKSSNLEKESVDVEIRLETDLVE